jgi:hypothetical protein
MATREEIYAAIKNADAAGDSASVRKLGEYLKSLPEESAPAVSPGSIQDIAQHQQRLADLTAELEHDQEPLTKLRRVSDNLTEAGKDWFKGGAESAATIGSQMVSTPVAGLTGLVMSPVSPFGAAVRGVSKLAGVDVPNSGTIVENVQNAFTYRPRSEAGQQSVENISKPFTWFAGKADRAGEAVSKATGSPALGATVNTAIQAIPMILTKGGRAPLVNAGRAAVDTARASIGGDAAAAAARAQTAAVEAQSTAAAAANAEKYARSVGLDWDALAGEIKTKLTDIARTSGELERLDPAALKRYATLQGLKVPVPATRGALERNSVQLRNEGNTAATAEGAPIRAIQEAGDNALQANLDVLRGRVAGRGNTAATATSAEEAGATVQGAARAKEAASKANYDRLYKIARETEPEARASVAPVTDLLTENPEIQHLGWVQTWLNRAAKLAGGKEGQPIAITDATLAELDDLRKLAAANAKSPGDKGFYAKQVSAAIDQAMQDVPAAAKAWGAARDAFKAHKMQFAEQGAVADLVDQSTRTDRATALEKTVDTITKGSLEDIRKVKKTLLTGGDEATRAAGKKAMREIRAQVLDRIKREATKSATEKADGTPNLSVARLKQVIDSYGPEKLDEIFGPGNAREVYRILDAAKIVKTVPAQGIPVGSSTLQNIFAFLGKGLDKIPLVGKSAVDIARGAAKVKEIGADARTASAATTTPLNEALASAVKRGRAKSRREAAALPLKTTPISSLSAGANQQ